MSVLPIQRHAILEAIVHCMKFGVKSGRDSATIEKYHIRYAGKSSTLSLA
jgi:hypothetical protein